MPLRRVELPPEVTGSLWLASMPGRFEPWPSFVAEAEQARLDLLVCLTPMLEVQQLSPTYHAAVARGRLPFRWTLMPMRNFGLPDDLPAFTDTVQSVAGALKAGDAVLLHCAAGLGRTGSAAACVLKALGLETQEALRRVQEAGSNPQNAMQSGLVDSF